MDNETIEFCQIKRTKTRGGEVLDTLTFRLIPYLLERNLNHVSKIEFNQDSIQKFKSGDYQPISPSDLELRRILCG